MGSVLGFWILIPWKTQKFIKRGVSGLEWASKQKFAWRSPGGLGWVLFQGTQLLIDQIIFFRSMCKWQKSVKDIVKDIVPSLKQAMQMVGSGHSLSVALSRQRQVQEKRNQINGRAREQEALIDKEERNLEEQTAAASMEVAIIAAKAKTDGAKVRRELDRRRFEIEATLSESLAQIEDENANDLSSACPNVPGNVMTGTCNCNCNFDMNMFLRNVENSV
jgi:hypothetical protein